MISLIILDSKKCLGIHFLYGSAPNAGLPTKINLDSLVLKVHVVPVSIDLKIYFEMALIEVKFFSLDRLEMFLYLKMIQKFYLCIEHIFLHSSSHNQYNLKYFLA